MPHFYKYFRHNDATFPYAKIFKWLMITLTVVALSDPAISKRVPLTKKSAIEIVLAIDTSGSMSSYGFNENDYNQSRLDVVKSVVTQFIKKRENDAIGLVVFGTHVAIASPLSFDTKAQLQKMQSIKVGVVGRSTALIDAVVASTSLFKGAHAKSKIIILLSDGDDSSSKAPLSVALKFAKKEHIKIYTITIDKSYSDTMKLIAKNSATKNFEVRTKESLREVYATIDKLEKSKITYTTVVRYNHIYSYFLSAAFMLALALLLALRRGEI